MKKKKKKKKKNHSGTYIGHTLPFTTQQDLLRIKVIASWKGLNLNIVRNIQYTEVENNSLEVSNREELRLYFMKSRKD